MKMLALLCSVCLMPWVAQGMNTEHDWPMGSPNYCLSKAHKMYPNINKYTLQVLPGRGWDDLLNQDRGLVLETNYSQCDVNVTMEYLMPNNFAAEFAMEGRRTSTEQYIGEAAVTSVNKRSPNKSSKLDTAYRSIIGFYGSENMQMRTTREITGTGVIRTSIIYPVLKVWAKPEASLSPAFKKRLLAIAKSIEQNQKELALFDTQILVRDYGTHVLNEMTLGGGLFKEDYISVVVLNNADHNLTAMNTAKTSTEVHFGLNKTEPEADEADLRAYKGWLVHETASRRGGKLTDYTEPINDWISSLTDEQMVPVNRIGTPLYDIIVQKREELVEIPDTTMAELKDMLINTIDLYYRMNTIPGCTDRKLRGYSKSANLMEPSTCMAAPTTEYLFGGVYQTCKVTGSFANEDPCKELDINNIATGAKSCPKDYTPSLLYTKELERTDINRSCESCGMLWLSKCCNTVLQSRATYSAYWCHASASNKAEHVFFFGGAFTSSTFNRITGMKNCPMHHTTVRLLRDLHICVNQDRFRRAGVTNLPFAGFFSCSYGNQLIPEASKDCPAGYSKIMVADEQGCGIYYCTHVGQMGPQSPMRLPYTVQPPTFLAVPVEIENLVYDVENRKWQRTDISLIEPIDGLKYWEVAAVCISCACACILVCFFLFYYLFRRWQEKQEQKMYGSAVN